MYGFLTKSVALFAIVNSVIATSVGIDITKLVPYCQSKAQNGHEVSVHYTGKLADGTVFDSSLSRGDPISFKLGAGMVIKGWEEGILNMCIGEKRTLNIPSQLGYGTRGIGPIPPNADLVFDVELVAIKGVKVHEEPQVHLGDEL